MTSNSEGGAYRSRVRLVSQNWRRKVEFATPQAERAITNTIDALAGLLDEPMTADGEPVVDDRGRILSRRKFWTMADPADALSLAEDAAAIGTLVELADILFLARFEPPILNALYANRAFVLKCAEIRDAHKNTILHWIAASDMPRKMLHGLMGALRALSGDETQPPGARNAARAALLAENDAQVKLHELAFALKDEALAKELLEARVSVREPNRAGQTFVSEALRGKSDAGEEYLHRLKTIAGEAKLEDAEAELAVTAEDRARARMTNERDQAIQDLITGKGRAFREHVRRAIDVDGGHDHKLFFETTPRDAAKNRGEIAFGQRDRLARDWMVEVLRHGDGELLDRCMTLVERRADAIADVYCAAKAGLLLEDVRRQLLRVYLKTPTAERKSLLSYAIETRKGYFVKRLLDSALYPPHEITNERDPKRRDAMRNRNMQMLAGARITDNLYMQTALLDKTSSDVDQDAATTSIMKILEILFEPLDDEQGNSVFQTYYEIGGGKQKQRLPFYDFVSHNQVMLPRVKEGLLFYADMYMSV